MDDNNYFYFVPLLHVNVKTTIAPVKNCIAN